MPTQSQIAQQIADLTAEKNRLIAYYYTVSDPIDRNGANGQVLAVAEQITLLQSML